MNEIGISVRRPSNNVGNKTWQCSFGGKRGQGCPKAKWARKQTFDAGLHIIVVQVMTTMKVLLL